MWGHALISDLTSNSILSLISSFSSRFCAGLAQIEGCYIAARHHKILSGLLVQAGLKVDLSLKLQQIS